MFTQAFNLKRESKYLYIAVAIWMMGMLTIMIPVIELFSDGQKPIFNASNHGFSYWLLLIATSVSGFITAMYALKFMSLTYWGLEKPEPKRNLKIIE